MSTRCLSSTLLGRGWNRANSEGKNPFSQSLQQWKDNCHIVYQYYCSGRTSSQKRSLDWLGRSNSPRVHCPQKLRVFPSTVHSAHCCAWSLVLCMMLQCLVHARALPHNCIPGSCFAVACSRVSFFFFFLFGGWVPLGTSALNSRSSFHLLNTESQYSDWKL